MSGRQPSCVRCGSCQQQPCLPMMGVLLLVAGRGTATPRTATTTAPLRPGPLRMAHPCSSRHGSWLLHWLSGMATQVGALHWTGGTVGQAAAAQRACKCIFNIGKSAELADICTLQTNARCKGSRMLHPPAAALGECNRKLCACCSCLLLKPGLARFTAALECGDHVSLRSPLWRYHLHSVGCFCDTLTAAAHQRVELLLQGGASTRGGTASTTCHPSPGIRRLRCPTPAPHWQGTPQQMAVTAGPRQVLLAAASLTATANLGPAVHRCAPTAQQGSEEAVMPSLRTLVFHSQTAVQMRCCHGCIHHGCLMHCASQRRLR
jgi:hypothetical protein